MTDRDIAAELRAQIKTIFSSQFFDRLFKDGADEIDRLKTLLNQANERNDKTVMPMLSLQLSVRERDEQIDRLKAECEKYREALSALLTACEKQTVNLDCLAAPTPLTEIIEAYGNEINIARDALNIEREG